MTRVKGHQPPKFERDIAQALKLLMQACSLKGPGAAPTLCTTLAIAVERAETARFEFEQRRQKHDCLAILAAAIGQELRAAKRDDVPGMPVRKVYARITIPAD